MPFSHHLNRSDPLKVVRLTYAMPDMRRLAGRLVCGPNRVRRRLREREPCGVIFGIWTAVRLFAETRHKPTPVLNLARRIDAATPRTARVYVWASNANSLPFHLNRPPASRFFMPMHAVAPLLSASFMPELVADLERAQPAIVADCWQNDFSQLTPQRRCLRLRRLRA